MLFDSFLSFHANGGRSAASDTNSDNPTSNASGLSLTTIFPLSLAETNPSACARSMKANSES